MRPLECENEQEILAAIQRGQWEMPVAERLRAHAQVCPICADVALVAGLLQDDGSSAARAARLPAADFIWWKAQLRARREAMEHAAEPVAIAERTGLAFGALVFVGVLVWLWPSVARAAKRLAGYSDLSSLWQSVAAAAGRLGPEWFSQPSSHWVLACGGLLLLLASLVYFAWVED